MWWPDVMCDMRAVRCGSWPTSMMESAPDNRIVCSGLVGCGLGLEVLPYLHICADVFGYGLGGLHGAQQRAGGQRVGPYAHVAEGARPVLASSRRPASVRGRS